jgi:hypothetical protein
MDKYQLGGQCTCSLMLRPLVAVEKIASYCHRVTTQLQLINIIIIIITYPENVCW